MAQRNDRVLKVKILVDGDELQGLVKVSGIKMIDVPGYDRIVKIQNGIKTIPQLDLEFKDSVGGNSNDYMNGWFENNEVHDVMWLALDNSGKEFDRISLPSCECQSYERPEYDASNPGYSKTMHTLLPYDAKRIKQ
jgi:hypothetical protein